jgi:ribosomal protein L13
MNRQTTIVTNDQAQHNWLLVDATDQVLGRLSAKLAMILMGKTKPTYTPNADTGDFVPSLRRSSSRPSAATPAVRSASATSG